MSNITAAGLPYALREAGFVMGLILLVVLGCVTDWTIRLIVLNAKMSGRKTYIDIMDTCGLCQRGVQERNADAGLLLRRLRTKRPSSCLLLPIRLCLWRESRSSPLFSSIL